MTTAPHLRPGRLLVLACSATKRLDPEPIQAIERYDGPLWRTLRAADPEGRLARVAVLSARYGFRDAATPIAAYDAPHPGPLRPNDRGRRQDALAAPALPAPA